MATSIGDMYWLFSSIHGRGRLVRASSVAAMLNCPEWFTLFIAAARLHRRHRGHGQHALPQRRSGRYRQPVRREGAVPVADFRGIDFPAILRDIDPGDLALG